MLYLRRQFVRGYTSIYFGENQLSPSLISLSLLSTPHPPHFQLWWVRSSRRCYPRFNLAMDRSLRFRVYATRLVALLGLAFASAPPIGLTLPRNVTRRPIMQKVRGHTFPCGHSAPTACRHTVSGTISLPSPGFFSPFPRGTCSLSVDRVVFSLGGWSSQIPAGLHVSCGTRVPAQRHLDFRLQGCHLLWPAIPGRSTNAPCNSHIGGPTTPRQQALDWFRLVPVRSPLLGESRLISFPPGT